MSYLLMLFSAGLPIFLLEIYLGQYTGMGPVKIFASLTPLLSGLGYVREKIGGRKRSLFDK